MSTFILIQYNILYLQIIPSDIVLEENIKDKKKLCADIA